MSRLWISLLFAFTVDLVGGRIVELDWTPSSDLFDRGLHTTTIIAKQNDMLKFRCATDFPFEIHIVPALDALGCIIRPTALKRPMGFCGPNTPDPRMALREYSATPGAPSFKKGERYYFVAVGNATKAGDSRELCDRLGMRMRVMVLPRDDRITEDRLVEKTETLWLIEQAKPQQTRPSGRSVMSPAKVQANEIALPLQPEESPSNSPKERSQQRENTYYMRSDQEVYDFSGRGVITIQPPHGFKPMDPTHYAMANRFPEIDFEIGYEDASSGMKSTSSIWTLIIFSSFLLLRRLL